MPTHDAKQAARALRYGLTLTLLAAPRPLTVRELVDVVTRRGQPVPGRPGKTISDALRWEVRRGRVRRVARSTYTAGTIPESTVRWMRWWLAGS